MSLNLPGYKMQGPTARRSYGDLSVEDVLAVVSVSADQIQNNDLNNAHHMFARLCNYLPTKLA